MGKIKLYKNDNVVLEKEADKVENGLYYFDNIVYDSNTLTLIREDANFKFELQFNESLAVVTLKQEGTGLDLDLSNVIKEVTDKMHKIYYNIESEETINNMLEITL